MNLKLDNNYSDCWLVCTRFLKDWSYRSCFARWRNKTRNKRAVSGVKAKREGYTGFYQMSRKEIRLAGRRFRFSKTRSRYFNHTWEFRTGEKKSQIKWSVCYIYKLLVDSFDCRINKKKVMKVLHWAEQYQWGGRVSGGRRKYTVRNKVLVFPSPDLIKLA